MSRRIRAVSIESVRLDWLTHALVCTVQDRILLDYTRIENVHKVRKKTFDFLLCIEVQQSFSCPFSLLKQYQMPECFYVNNSGF